MKYVKIDEKNMVREIISEFDPSFPGISVKERYCPNFLAQCMVVSDDTEVEPDYKFNELDGTFQAM